MANEVKDMTAVTSDTETQIWGTSPQIIVTGTAERPFYQIMYRENKDGEIHLGFGSYDLSYVFNWLKEFFGVTRASAVDPESLRPKGRWDWKHRHKGGFRKYTGVDAFGETHTITVDERFECDEPYCPKCGKWNESIYLNYCPNCGAKMEE